MKKNVFFLSLFVSVISFGNIIKIDDGLPLRRNSLCNCQTCECDSSTLKSTHNTSKIYFQTHDRPEEKRPQASLFRSPSFTKTTFKPYEFSVSRTPVLQIVDELSTLIASPSFATPTILREAAKVEDSSELAVSQAVDEVPVLTTAPTPVLPTALQQAIKAGIALRSTVLTTPVSQAVDEVPVLTIASTPVLPIALQQAIKAGIALRSTVSTTPVSQAMDEPFMPVANSTPVVSVSSVSAVDIHRIKLNEEMMRSGEIKPEITRQINYSSLGRDKGYDRHLKNYKNLLFIDLCSIENKLKTLSKYGEKLGVPFLIIDLSWLANLQRSLLLKKEKMEHDRQHHKCKLCLLTFQKKSLFEQYEQPLHELQEKAEHDQHFCNHCALKTERYQNFLQQKTIKKFELQQDIEELIFNLKKQMKDLKKSIQNDRMIFESDMMALKAKTEEKEADKLKYCKDVTDKKIIIQHLGTEQHFKEEQEKFEEIIFSALNHAIEGACSFDDSGQVWQKYSKILGDIGLELSFRPTEKIIKDQVHQFVQNLLSIELSDTRIRSSEILACIPNLSLEEVDFESQLFKIIQQKNEVCISRERISQTTICGDPLYFDHLSNIEKEIRELRGAVKKYQDELMKIQQEIDQLISDQQFKQDTYDNFQEKIKFIIDLEIVKDKQTLQHVRDLLGQLHDHHLKSNVLNTIDNIKQTLEEKNKTEETLTKIDLMLSAQGDHQQELIAEELKAQKQCNIDENVQDELETERRQKVEFFKHHRKEEQNIIKKDQQMIEKINCLEKKCHDLYVDFNKRKILLSQFNEEWRCYKDGITSIDLILEEIQIPQNGCDADKAEKNRFDDFHYPDEIIEVRIDTVVKNQTSSNPLKEYLMNMHSSLGGFSLQDELVL